MVGELLLDLQTHTAVAGSIILGQRLWAVHLLETE